jgi:hypothetical protein
LKKEDIDCIVFWTKNPAKIIDRLDEIDDIPYYFHFTINSYPQKYETGLPQKDILIDTFIRLSRKTGKEKVLWRYDPIFLSNDIDISFHTENFRYISERLSGYTEKCTVSFIDEYRKIKRIMKEFNIRRPDSGESEFILKNISQTAEKQNIIINTCCEKQDFSHLNIERSSCIDKRLIEKISGRKINVEKDKNQRDYCNCIKSADIGHYRTCQHNCVYCYAR